MLAEVLEPGSPVTSAGRGLFCWTVETWFSIWTFDRLFLPSAAVDDETFKPVNCSTGELGRGELVEPRASQGNFLC